MEENFSANIKDVIGLSRDEALRLSNNCIGTEHFILGIIQLKNSGAIKLLINLGIEVAELRNNLEIFAKSKTKINLENPKTQIPLKKEAEKALKTTFLEARVFNSDMIGTTHLLLCILRNDNDPTTKFLNNYNITYENIKEAFLKQLENSHDIKDDTIMSSKSEDNDEFNKPTNNPRKEPTNLSSKNTKSPS